MTGGAVHQGLARQVPAYEYAHPDDLLARALDAGEAPLLVALDGVTDPRNLGAVVRSAAAFGGHGVLVPERRAAGMTAGAWKTSAGAAARIPVARATNLTRPLKAYQKAGCMVVGLAADGDGPGRPRARRRSAGASSSAPRARACRGSSPRPATCSSRIPMHAETESLNAGVAASIVLHAVAARRALPPADPLRRLAPSANRCRRH